MFIIQRYEVIMPNMLDLMLDCHGEEIKAVWCNPLECIAIIVLQEMFVILLVPCILSKAAPYESLITCMAVYLFIICFFVIFSCIFH